MSFHLAVYRGSQAIAATNASIPIIVGSGDTVQGTQYYPQDDMALLAACSFGTNIVDPRVSTPVLRNLGPQYIRPFNIATPLGSNFAVAEYFDNPIPLAKLNAIDVQGTNVDAGAQVQNTGLFMRVGAGRRAPTGTRRTLRWTGAATATANAWTTVAPTMVDSLPNGIYAVVGLQAFGTTMYAARFIFTGGGNQYRPGVMTVQTIGQRAPYELKGLQEYEWGRFIESSAPNLEILCTAADTAQTFLVDLVKVA